MDNVNKTLYIPLYGKAFVSRKNIILKDKKAEEIWEKEKFPLKGRSKSKWLAYYMGMRSAVFDKWVNDRMSVMDDPVVIHIGCGMDSRINRVEQKYHIWYDVDFPEVIKERKRYFPENADYHMLCADVTVTGIGAKTYTGKAITQSPVVKLSGKTLKAGTDYTVAYKNNTKVGTATVTITGKGSYTGTISKTFKINAASIAKATVSGISNKTYTGKAITQNPTVKLGSKTLKKGTDYTVSYKNNKAVGKATVTIKGKGNYTGTISKTFKINPKKTTLKTATSPKTKQLKVTYSKVSGVTGYQTVYSTSSKFTKATTKTASSKSTSKTISGLTKGKTYYVKVRTYKTVNGTKYYSGYSAVKKKKIK